MFNFRTATIVFFFFLLLMNVVSFMWTHIPAGYYLLLIAIYLGISVTASFFVCSGFHMKAICRKETEQKVLAITFDDGPHPGNTPAILDVLKGRASATFFCIGSRIVGNEGLIRRMNEEGHLIGMHSYSHSNWFDFFPARKMEKEFARTEETIQKILMKRPLLFRPPYGVINPMVKKALSSFPYHIIGYSNRSFDTVIREESKIISRILRKLKPGDIILLHDTVPFAPSLLDKLLTKLSEQGFIVLGLDEMLKIRVYDEKQS
jgi:peptidoglycan-N-acetylglucosamine deacetylase